MRKGKNKIVISLTLDKELVEEMDKIPLCQANRSLYINDTLWNQVRLDPHSSEAKTSPKPKSEG